MCAATQKDPAKKFAQGLIRASAWFWVDEKTRKGWGIIRRRSLVDPAVIVCMRWEINAERRTHPERTSLAAKVNWRKVTLQLHSGRPRDIEPLQDFRQRRVVRASPLAFCMGFWVRLCDLDAV
jgi:hypothetical protein